MINISEGRDRTLLDELARASGPSLRDLHADPWHHRSVFTLINEPDQLVTDVRSLISWAFEILDLARHDGVHPRFGVVDVVPFVALDPSTSAVAEILRDDIARWISAAFGVPTFLYGPVTNGELRTLPDVRARAFKGLNADFGPVSPSPRWGAVAVGVRPILVAWNLWLSNVRLERARELAKAVRGPTVRSLAFAVSDQVQVSCNLIDVLRTPPSEVYDKVQSLLVTPESVGRSELVGLIPAALLDIEGPRRWAQLDLDPSSTIEDRLRAVSRPGNDAR